MAVGMTLSGIGELLRLMLAEKELSYHQVQRLVQALLAEQRWAERVPLWGTTIRHKLSQGNEWQLSVEELLFILEAAGIDKEDFFARAANFKGFSLAMFGPPEAPRWSGRPKKILEQVAKVKKRGCAGYLEARAELRQIELLRDQNPRAAEAAAWDFLSRNRAPGALVGALAILAVEAQRPFAHDLLRRAFDLLGADRRSAAGAKLLTATGRALYMVGEYRWAMTILEDYALKVVSLFGDPDEIALVCYYLGISASKLGDSASSRAALEQCLKIGSERWRFATLQHLAFEELNGGDLARAAQMYDELVAMAFFERSDLRAQTVIRWSRLTAHFLAGHLDSSTELEFRAAVEAVGVHLDPRSRAAAALDLALYLKQIGKPEAARTSLKAEHFNVLDLEDCELQSKFIGLWESLGMPEESWRTLISRREARCRQPRALPNPPGRIRGPKGRVARPTT